MYRCYKGAAIRKANVTFVARAIRQSIQPGCPRGTVEDGKGLCMGCSWEMDPAYSYSYSLWAPSGVALCVPNRCCLTDAGEPVYDEPEYGSDDERE
jgi:hypothetical protein